MVFIFPAFGWAWQGTVTNVVDGDTLVVRHDGKEELIDLYGIACPDIKQMYGEHARQLTAYMVLQKTVEVIPVGRSGEGRINALIRASGQRDFVNERLVGYGMAWVDGRTCKAKLCEQWKKLEDMAQLNLIGLWVEAQPVPPWEWRKQRRGDMLKRAQP